MSYQPQYIYTTAPRAAHHYWLDLAIKAGTLLGGAAIAATLGVHMIHAYSPPARSAPVAQIVAYYSKGVGRAGESSHWTMEASEGTLEWRKAVRYCQAQAQQSAEGQSAPRGCAIIQTLAESGY